MKRRDFIKTAAGAGTLAALGGGMGAMLASCGSWQENAGMSKLPKPYIINGSVTNKMKLSCAPYELLLADRFTVSSYSRTTTPDVQIELSYDGFTGYGEASMPPYLGHTVESVMAFLTKVDLGQFADPFCIEDIMAYVDSLSDGDEPAKAAIDIALHDLVGKLLGQPLYRIWGYNAAKAPATSFTISIDTAENVRKKAAEVASRFKVLKLKVGLDNDVEMV